MSNDNTEIGTVKWFNDDKGFGFITPEKGGKDLFAHFKEIRGDGFKSLSEGQRVQFEITQGQKVLQASNIRPDDRSVVRDEESRGSPRFFFALLALP